MTITLKEDVAYLLLQEIDSHASQRKANAEPVPLNLSTKKFVGRNTNKTEIFAHLDYLNQKGYLNVNFVGNAYANAGINPFSEAIQIDSAELTERGKRLLARMSENFPKALMRGESMPIATKDMDFLEKVMLKGNMSNLYDARDATELVFRTMRDLMTTRMASRIAKDLTDTPAASSSKATIPNSVEDLWRESNPLVRFLSDIRSPLIFDDKTFLFRVEKEGGVPKKTNAETVVKAVFSATKDVLPPEQITKVADAMPGRIHALWQEA